MSTDALKIQVDSSYQEIEHANLEQELAEPIDFVRSQGATGEAASWIAITSLGLKAIPEIFKFLRALLDSKKVVSVEYRDLKVKNPTDEMIKMIEHRIRKDFKGP